MLEVLLVHPGGPFWAGKDDGAWSIAPTPDLSGDQGDNGLAGIAAIPGGGIWAVGLQTNPITGAPQTLIEYHP